MLWPPDSLAGPGTGRTQGAARAARWRGLEARSGGRDRPWQRTTAGAGSLQGRRHPGRRRPAVHHHRVDVDQRRTSIDPAAHTLADTHAGGALLWIAGELVTLTALAALVVQVVQAVQAVHWMHDEERAAARADRRLATISAARMGVSRPGARPA